MGLTDTIKSAVSAGFAAAGDIKTWFVFQEVSSTTYDPDTGDTNEVTDDSGLIQGFQRDYTVKEIEAGVASAGDKRLVVQADDIDFDLSVIDRVLMGGAVFEADNVMIGGDAWQVKDFQPDAVGAAYIIRVVK